MGAYYEGLAPGTVRQTRLKTACRRHRVKRLELFGSAASGRFDPSRGDLDFLVEFFEMPPEELADAYFGLLEELEEIFNLPVELVTDASAKKNPYFLENVERNKVLIYAGS